MNAGCFERVCRLVSFIPLGKAASHGQMQRWQAECSFSTAA